METKHHFRRGERVLVEAYVVSYEAGRPFGAVTVRFPEGTDPEFRSDGYTAVLPQAIVFPLDTSGVDEPNDYIDYGSYYEGDIA